MPKSDTQFKSGQTGNPGGRPRKQLTELRELLEQTFPQAARERVARRLVADAEAGNHDARVLLLAYTYGKPVDRKEISGPEGEPLKLYTWVSPDDWDSPTDAGDT